MQLVAALLIGAALGAATIPYLPAPEHREDPDDWVRDRFSFHTMLDPPLIRYRAPFEQRRLRFE